MDINHEDDAKSIPKVLAVQEDKSSSIARQCLEGFMYSGINLENYTEVGERREFEKLLSGLSETEKRDVYNSLLKTAKQVRESKPTYYPDYHIAVEYFKRVYFHDIIVKGGNETRPPLTDSEIQQTRKKAREERNFYIAPKVESIDNKVA